MQNTREISKARRAARAAAHATEKRAKDAGAERAIKAMLRSQRDLLKARAANPRVSMFDTIGKAKACITRHSGSRYEPEDFAVVEIDLTHGKEVA